MTRTRSGIFAVFACAAAVSVAAQTPPPPSSDQARASASNKITITGCLERADSASSPTGTSGSTMADSSKFVLKNVTPAGSTGSATGTAGTAGTAGSASMSKASSYRLDADDAKLTPHVGHKVEISGTVDNQASATGATASASAPKLKVDTVKMIAASCTP